MPSPRPRPPGVKRIVYTSMPHPEPGNIIPMALDHYATEQAVKATGIELHDPAQQLVHREPAAGAATGSRQRQVVTSASGQGRISHVTRDDTARAAAGALLSDHAGNRVFTVTGREAFTNAEIAAIATEVLGKPIEVVDVPDAGYTEGLKQAGLPAPVAPSCSPPFEIGQRHGILSMVTDAVEELWGTPAMTVREFLAANRAGAGR